VTTDLRRIVVADANVLINLMHVSRLGLLAKIPNHEFMVPEHVREETSRPEHRAALDTAVGDGWLKIEVMNDLGAITVFTELIANIGRGEAACIAIAAHKGWHIASDEKKRFLREAKARVGVGRVITTVDVFVLAIKAGVRVLSGAREVAAGRAVASVVSAAVAVIGAADARYLPP
jgi:predicted nucleic acid-binding protein